MKKILVDGAFKEETRVALVDNGILEEYDREDYSFNQLKGNIYLAKVTKIEPSLQAAFIDYGGDKHGFLPFSDIHPDYYNIADDDIKNLKTIKFFQNEDELEETSSIESLEIDESLDGDKELDDVVKNTNLDTENDMEDLNHYSVEEEVTYNLRDDCRKYKIEDVIKVGQYLLVQVLKEERGNKGVATTTYISLAGKYCVLMANTPDRSGISKKINSINDRRLLKSILRSLKVPQAISLILRTAALDKKPEDILKDYLYLIRLWKAIKLATFDSEKPVFIHAEDDIIKRVIRDNLTDSVDEIVVEGSDTFKTIKGLVKSIFGSNKDIEIKLHNDKIPLFHKYRIEEQLLELYNNKVMLPSGGSIVIDQTEALVAIDVNSGKATKESSVEDMAVTTNVEAAKEIARQLKLRDLAGLVVVDFIDMFEIKNRRIVEKAMRDSLMRDRAKIQFARLSIFGLMEISRQRLGASLAEKTSCICPKCKGKGKIKSKEIVALNIFREIKYVALDKQINVITVEAVEELYSYIINFKRKEIAQIEQNYNIYLFFEQNNDIDNSYNIKKRKSLTEEEREELEPKDAFGKVNINFDDKDLYSLDANDMNKYKFEEYNNKQLSKSDNSKKYYSKYQVSNFSKPKKKNWLQKILGM